MRCFHGLSDMPTASLNTEGQPSFDICQRGSCKFLWCSDPRNHWNHYLLWNSSAPSPLMPQTNPPHILRTNILAYVCVYLHVLHCVWSYEHMHICFSVCVTLCASWVVSAPGVFGVLHFQFRRELGLLCGSNSGEDCDLLIAEGQTWLALFSEKPSHAPEWDNNHLNPVWLFASPKISKSLHKLAWFILSLFLSLSVLSLEIKYK